MSLRDESESRAECKRKARCSVTLGGPYNMPPHGLLPGSACVWHIWWLPHGYAPTHDDFIACVVAEPDDLETAIRLEVSGTSDGNSSVIENRLKQKLEQTSKGDSNLPAIATVVGFSQLRIVIADLGGS